MTSLQPSMPDQLHEIKLFSGQATHYLAQKIAASYGKALGKYSLNRFSDGEFQPRFEESIRGCHVFLIQSTFSPSDNLMELLLMIDAAKRASAHYISVVIPYFGLARQDRKDQPRVSIGSKLVANMLTAAGAIRVMTMDLHAAQIQGFFDIPVDNLEAATFFVPYIAQLKLPRLTIAAPDMGGTSRARLFAKHLECEMVVADKQRKIANQVETIQVIGDVKDRDIVIVDDIVDTAGTICKAADVMLEKGANSVRAVCTHPVLSGKAFENIENSNLKELIVSDTLPLRGESNKIRVISSAHLFADAINNVHNYGSVSQLFKPEMTKTAERALPTNF